MNTAKLRRKRVLLPAAATLAVVAVGATVWTSSASDDVRGSERDRVAAAATEAVGGTAVDVEASDDRGEAFEVEVRLDDGTEVDVALDEDLDVVGEDRDDRGDRGDRDDSDGRALGSAERSAAERAALAAVDGATSAHVEASDDPGVAYEAEVIDADHREWDVDLDADLNVVHTSLED